MKRWCVKESVGVVLKISSVLHRALAEINPTEPSPLRLIAINWILKYNKDTLCVVDAVTYILYMGNIVNILSL